MAERKQKTPEVRIKYVPLSEVEKWPRNPKKHDLDAIRESIRRFGFVQPAVVDERSGRLVAGHGRQEALSLMRENGEEPPARIKTRGKDWLLPVIQGVGFVSELEAEAYLLADNKLTEIGGWDEDMLAGMMKDLVDADIGAIGWDQGDIDSLLAVAEQGALGDEDSSPEQPPAEPVSSRKRSPGVPEDAQIFHGDSVEVLRTLPAESVDALVTDPPSGISFMGKDWDTDKGGRKEWVTWLCAIMQECLRVLKPGAYGLVWAIPRTSHWTATALEEAGFEIRDVVTHLYGSGFPKSVNISKGVDSAQGAIREVIGQKFSSELPSNSGYGRLVRSRGLVQRPVTVSTTEEAKSWDGYGTGLKPSSEHWILVRKPLDGTLVANALKHGTGGIDVEGCRVGDDILSQRVRRAARLGTFEYEGGVTPSREGRWPSNTLLSHEEGCSEETCIPECPVAVLEGQWAGASKFFYCPKPTTAEREAGCDELPLHTPTDLTGREEGSAGLANGRAGSAPKGGVRNHHPTIKSIELMRYFVRLVSRQGHTVLDPFMGAGATGIAALLEGCRFIGIDQNAEYVEIARARIAHHVGSDEDDSDVRAGE